jgi:hypothetical protein
MVSRRAKSSLASGTKSAIRQVVAFGNRRYSRCCPAKGLAGLLWSVGEGVGTVDAKRMALAVEKLVAAQLRFAVKDGRES